MTGGRRPHELSVGDRGPELAGRTLGIPGGGEDVHMFKRL
jgi:hypothetical protein